VEAVAVRGTVFLVERLDLAAAALVEWLLLVLLVLLILAAVEVVGAVQMLPLAIMVVLVAQAS
jgi:hypothetical protein